MSQAPQYQPTPELQKVLDQLTPSILQSTKLQNQALRLRSFSKVEENPNQFILYAEAKDQGNKKLYKIKISQ